MDETDRRHLTRCVDLAEAALVSGNDPFGSVLVGADGTVLREDHNRTAGGDETRHPEFELARWAAENMTPDARAGATVKRSRRTARQYFTMGNGVRAPLILLPPLVGRGL